MKRNDRTQTMVRPVRRARQLTGALTAGVAAVLIAGCTSDGDDTATDTGRSGGSVVALSPSIGAGPPVGSSRVRSGDGSKSAAGSGSVTAGTAPGGAGNQSGLASTQGGSSATGGSPVGSAHATASLFRAAHTALAKVPGSTLVSIEVERHNTRWEVQVVTPDGTEHHIELAADGTTVLAGPAEQNDSESDKAKHRDRVAAAKLDYSSAIDKLMGQIPDGRIGELNLDSQDGRIIWEADVYDSSGTKHEMSVDAATGELVGRK